MKSRNIFSEKKYWPLNLNDKIYDGFSNEELEYISNLNLIDSSIKLPKQDVAALYWQVELYSFGRCYREWLGIPSWCPLPLNGDHGVVHHGLLFPEDLNVRSNIFLTWSKERAKNLIKTYKKKILHITHPWIIFRNLKKIKKKKNSKGTLIFIYHGNEGYKLDKFNFKKYFDELKGLPSKYHPLVICVHNHDIKTQEYLKLKKFGLPIISAGNSLSPYFVDRFYSIISRFNYGTSNHPGSELFYCEELGLKYFLKGKTRKINTSIFKASYNKILEDNLHIKNIKEMMLLFKKFPPKKTQSKKKFVSRVLGLNVDKKKSRVIVLNCLLVEFFRHIHLLPFNLLKTFIKRNKNFILIKPLIMIKNILVN